MEILNSARAFGYIESASCPVSWIVCPPCDGLDEALGDIGYLYPNISEAPWYDVEDEATHRFLGAHTISIEGLPDSTREASVTEGVLDGGVVGRQRKATRRIRVRALLSGMGQDGLEAGFNWLDAALTAGHCKLHSGACGSADAQFFVACPPTKESVTSPATIWGDTVTNLAKNPSFEQATAATVEVRRNYARDPQFTAIPGIAPHAAMAYSLLTDYPGSIATALRSTRIAEGIARLADVVVGTTIPANGQAVRVRMKVRASASIAGVQVSARPNVTLAGNGSNIGLSFTIPAGESIIDLTGNYFTAAPAGTAGFTLVSSGGIIGDTLDITEVLIEQGGLTGFPYFDGSTVSTDTDLTYAWSGTVNNSPSVQRGIVVPSVSPGTVGQVVPYSTATGSHGAKALRYKLLLAAPAAVAFSVADFPTVIGTTYTLLGKVRPVSRNQQFTPCIGNTLGTPFTAPMGVWTEFRFTAVATTASAPQTGLLIPANSGSAHLAGDLVDLDEVLIAAGQYDGAYFDGSTPDIPPSNVVDAPVHDFGWTGAADASTSTFAGGRIAVLPDPVLWQEKVDKLTRYLHTVTCVAGPTIEEKFHRGDTWGYIVEFVLVSATPWMFGVTRPVDLAVSLPVIVQDVPFNLVPYPSAELTLGTVVVSTNYATNPSLEVDAAGWAIAADGTAILPANVAGARSTELASAGPASYKSLFTAPSAGTNGWFGAQQTVALPGITATTRYSINLWAVASVQSGTAVVGNIEYKAYWQNAGGTTLRTDDLGILPAAGGALSVKSILPPAGTTKVIVRAFVRVTSWSTGALVRLYSDALAVTIP